MSEGVQGHLGMSSYFSPIFKPSNALACSPEITHLASSSNRARVLMRLKFSKKTFLGFRNALNAAMDAENLALAQEEATLTKIRTLLNQHKVAEALCKCLHMVGAGEVVGAPLL